VHQDPGGEVGGATDNEEDAVADFEYIELGVVGEQEIGGESDQETTSKRIVTEKVTIS